MTLEIISPSEIVFNGEVESVTLPGVLGSFTVLKRHASLISVLKTGELTYRLPGGEETVSSIIGGIADIDNDSDKVSVCIY